jgi:hypothetical protein
MSRWRIYLFISQPLFSFANLQLVATAALFLAAKSEETACLLNTVLRASCEVSQNQEFTLLPYMLRGVSNTYTALKPYILFMYSFKNSSSVLKLLSLGQQL